MQEFFLQNNELSTPSTKLKSKFFVYALIVVVILIVFNFFFLSAPGNFPKGIVVRIEPGMNLHNVSLKLKTEHIIRSRIVFKVFVYIFSGDKHIISADYFFEDKLSVWRIAWRVARGERYMAPVSVTIPEGSNVNQIANTFAAALVNFDKNIFLLKAKNLEGYLFPDTYFFLSTDTENSVLESMQKNFVKKITSLLPQIKESGKTEREIITMASLIEREAKGNADRGFISGILWKRFSMGMPLQVDVAPETYQTKGLPKSPVCNPGLASIQSALSPEKSSFLYYLHDKNGVIHYAKSFAEHRQNIEKYLK